MRSIVGVSIRLALGAVLAGLSGCGGHVSGGPGDADAAADGGDVQDGALDSRRLGPDASLPACSSTAECWGTATCQLGVCCSGVMIGDVCRCGGGLGCILGATCCVSVFDRQSGLACVASNLECGPP
jgi:hypothetical protein